MPQPLPTSSGFPHPASGMPHPPGYAFPLLMPSPRSVPPPPPPVAPGGAALAELTDRFIAHLIDMLILAACYLVLAAITIAIGWNQWSHVVSRLVRDETTTGRLNANPLPDLGRVMMLELILLAIILPMTWIVSYLYLVTLMHRGGGQTVGKRIMKIKVVSAVDGSTITRSQARRRWVVEQLSSLPAPYFVYADSLWLAWDKPYRQCLHDKCADTVVVKAAPQNERSIS